MTILISPTEHDLAEKLGGSAIVSSVPETRGADVLIYGKVGLVGLQRKEVPNDFIASFTDGRLTRETALLTKSCQFYRIVGEGKFRYWPDGRLVTGRINPKTKKPEPSRFTRSHVWGMLFDIEMVKGIQIDWTEDIDDTVFYIKSIVDFINRPKHLGLYTRPSATGTWYVPTAKDLHLWILQSFPGIGPAIADNIITYFGGRLPLKWDCTLPQLCAVPRLGKKKAEEIWWALQETTSTDMVPTEVKSDLLDNLRLKILETRQKILEMRDEG
jgi:ERCC4-type nuclease